MSSAESLEHLIRERAYHIWEANGRPAGRDEEFWHQARELLAAGAPEPKPERRRTSQAKSPSSRSKARRG